MSRGHARTHWLCRILGHDWTWLYSTPPFCNRCGLPLYKKADRQRSQRADA